MELGSHPDDVVDLERLREVSMGDKEFEGILLQAFIEDATTQMAALEEAAGKGAAAALAAAAHSLKGAASNLGMNEAQHICVALERMNPAEDPDGAEILLRQLRHELEKIRVFIKDHAGL
jgi:HPt (histidine-containing phosphotransfer) domain-containing protein